jgi:hypothetical protein
MRASAQVVTTQPIKTFIFMFREYTIRLCEMQGLMDVGFLVVSGAINGILDKAG